jgi:hypothetical protein
VVRRCGSVQCLTCCGSALVSARCPHAASVHTRVFGGQTEVCVHGQSGSDELPDLNSIHRGKVVKIEKYRHSHLGLFRPLPIPT